MTELFAYLKDGRISDIIGALKCIYGKNALSTLDVHTKLTALCLTLGLDFNEFDRLIAENSPVLRPVKGIAFEVAFQRILESVRVPVQDVGGDGDVDLIINGHHAQLKTPNLGGCKGDVLEYKTHKTHGAKSEKESLSYYHSIESFADFFVGLISYRPFRVFVVPKDRLERVQKDSSRIKSPFKLNASGSCYVNRFDLLGVNLDNADFSSIYATDDDELLPLTSRATGLKTEIIVDTILRECNFRIWDMSIRGFAREIALKKELRAAGIPFVGNPATVRPERGDKSDLAVLNDRSRYHFIQVKGCSVNNCRFDGDMKIATETQLTRGRVNDHPTQSRLYLASDFDYLALCIDPPIANRIGLGSGWAFCLIPSSELRRHAKYGNRYASMQTFSKNDILRFRVGCRGLIQALLES